jgi:hypothetical protein
MITKDVRHTREIKSNIILATAAFNRTEHFLPENCAEICERNRWKFYICRIAKNGAEAWTIWKLRQKHIEV